MYRHHVICKVQQRFWFINTNIAIFYVWKYCRSLIYSLHSHVIPGSVPCWFRFLCGYFDEFYRLKFSMWIPNILNFWISHNFTDLLSVYFLMDSQNAIGFGLVLTLAAINQGTRYSDVDVFLDGFVSDADILQIFYRFPFLVQCEF